MHLDFEYDNNKAIKNIEKHGMAFEEAKQLWDNFSTEAPGRSEKEERWLKIGKIREKIYTCVFTLRGTTIRIITLRRSWKKEEKFYYEEESKATQKNHRRGIGQNF